MLPLLLLHIVSLPTSSAFSHPQIRHRPPPSASVIPIVVRTNMAAGGDGNGEGGEAEWVKALMEAGGGGKNAPGKFEEEMKMKGLLGPNKGKGNPKLTANSRLVSWLETEGSVYLSELSTWGEAPHPMAISTETVDEITNESSGRGLLARRSISDGDELLKIPLDLCMTRRSARKALGKDALPEDINEYLAMACQLIREKYVMGEDSFYAPYMGVLPEVEEVNPTFTWPDEDLDKIEFCTMSFRRCCCHLSGGLGRRHPLTTGGGRRICCRK